ncbi:MAG: ABC transporter substrate-binding protein [Reyranella sp.]|uniref:ABC transporter substrate-binding protein n=1 Tax=Reyranella sp. TaxID=1929291 RepID=UPI003D0B0D38
MRRTIFTLFLALLLGSGSALAQSHLRIGLGDDPDGLDPSLSRFYTTRIVFAALCDKLFDIDEKSSIVPQLATGHETSADGKTVTIKLRPGVKFHDGEPFDAAAAKYSLERHITMKGSFRKPELSSIDSVEVADPLTVKLNLKAPFSPLLAQLTDRAGMMVSPKAAEASGDKFALKPVCAGPYRFVERVQQDRIVVEKFADYWNKDQVLIDKITYLPIVDSTVRLASLRSGGLDMMERVLATDIKTVRDDPKLKLSKAVSLGFFALLVNVANGPKADNPLGKDARVRRALDLSIDREALNQVVYNGEFMPGNQWVNPQNPYYQQAFPVPKRDIAKAKALLKEAGITGRLSVDFMLGNNPEIRAVGEVVQSMAAEAGFDLKLRVVEAATGLKTAEDGDFQLYQNTWSGRSDPDGNSVIYQTCGAPLNTGRYCDKEIDAWHREARSASDFATRKAAYEKITAKFLKEGWMIYLYHPQYLIAHTARLENFRPMPDGLLRVVGVKLK